MKDLISISRQLRDDLYSAGRIRARAFKCKDLFTALDIADQARKKACLRAVKAALPYLRGKTSDGAMYTRNSLLAAARTGQVIFIPDWIRYADRRR